jgi:stearoyl-CoA desaturase (delta-9 desaturase)
MYWAQADVNHQAISKQLSEADYLRAARFMRWRYLIIHLSSTGGDYCKSHLHHCNLVAELDILITVFYLRRSATLFVIFSGAVLCFGAGINYTGHGKGKEAHAEGLILTVATFL